MDRRQMIAIVGATLLCTWLVFESSVGQSNGLPPCNGWLPEMEKYCKQPFYRCSGAAQSKHCTSADQPAFISTDCIYTGNPNHLCTTLPVVRECNRIVACIWFESTNTCEEGDVIEPPTYVTAVESGPCEPPHT
jgi:hypothetical protein